MRIKTSILRLAEVVVKMFAEEISKVSSLRVSAKRIDKETLPSSLAKPRSWEHIFWWKTVVIWGTLKFLHFG